MKVRDYFMLGLRNKLHLKRHWMNNLFYVVLEMPKHGNDYNYCLHKDSDGIYFFTPGTEVKVYIDEYKEGRALLHFRDRFTLEPGEVINYRGREAIDTTYGNIYVNDMVSVIPFGDMFEFQTGLFDLKKLEAGILKVFKDDPPGISDEDLVMAPPGEIYVNQYVRFAEHILTLPAYADGLVTASTPKSLMCSPRRNEVRGKWLKDNASRLTDPAAVAELSALMKEIDDEYLEGDESNEFYRSKAKLEGARKRVHYMFGAESAFTDGTKVDLISKALDEGLDMDKLPAMFNSLRAGSYNRGAQTALGGESTKTIYRMVGTVRIVEPDCNSPIGIPTIMYPYIAKDLVGYAMVKDGVSTVLNTELIDKLMGQTVEIRGPMTCKSGRDVEKGILGKGKNICAVCAGASLAENPNGIPAAAAGVGGRFLSLFMAKMHASVLRTVKWEMHKRIT